MIEGARKLPAHHISIRAPWHDAGWNGTVCNRPVENTSCLILPRIGTSKRDDLELGCAGQRLDELSEDRRPPCVGEKVAFLSPFELPRVMRHPYSESSKKTHGHFDATPFTHMPFSAACVPFRWMLKSTVEGDAKEKIRGLADELQLGYEPKREPDLGFAAGWVQERDNQLVLLDTFFGALEPKVSLCFFYAKRTPLSDDNRRVILGVGRVLSVGPSTEYRYTTKTPPLRCVLWERNVMHSARPAIGDGFLFPYQELLRLSDEDASIRLEEHVAFAPDDFRAQFSYGSEHVPHDGAIASLISCAAALRKIKERIPGAWNDAIQWVDRELDRLWKARGPFPGLGSALCAFGLEHGNLIAYEIAAAQGNAKREWTEDPWELVDAVFADPAILASGVAKGIGKTFREKWKKLAPERRALLKLLSRCAVSADQATRIWQPTEREKANIEIKDRDLLENFYSAYELDRPNFDPVAFGTIDRGLFPDEVVQKAFPVPEPSHLTDAVDARRVRALVVDTLEGATAEGHTILPREWTIQRIRERALAPACKLDEDLLAVTEDTFAPLVETVPLAKGGRAFQLDRFAKTRALIVQTIRKRAKAPRHAGQHDWAKLVAMGIGLGLPSEADDRVAEERARQEKAAALKELYSARASVLIGPAGTGKTTLLRVLCNVPEVSRGGILLLAPTGKARVRLETQTGLRGCGKTIAQFLNNLERYDGSTGRYCIKDNAPKCGDYKTVIVDECSMLTEEQLAALLDALSGVDRLVLVGDPRQLPPIGAGRPFVDIVNDLAPEHVESMFPKQGRGYAELTITRRQLGADRDDLLLASYFNGRPLEPGADDIWQRLATGSSALRLVQWTDAADLHSKLVAELVQSLQLDGPEDQVKFELSVGGSLYNGKVFFWAQRNGEDGGAASKSEAWQILSPVRGTPHGVDAINRATQFRFRADARKMATPEDHWRRSIPPPLGPQALLWGDKVINVQNNGRRRCYPKQENPYVANGDIGVIVGEYKTRKFPGTPANLEVEFATQPGAQYKYWKSEFGGQDANPPLELAYALTVHKTQGSEFGITFVIVPNPCRLLSRELLYTALTRHRERLVLLHQGDVRDLLRYSTDARSEIAQRMTNLFRDARPMSITIDREKKFLEEGLIHRTSAGDLVRSKSELYIADKLHERKIKYLFEQSLTLADGSERYPDFTIRDDDSGVTYYWEHLGMLADPGYRRRWDRKLELYRRSGILPLEEGEGPNGRLIITKDSPDGGLDGQAITRIIDEVLT